MSGIAGGRDVILIPEQPISIDEACDDIASPPRARARTSRSSSIF
jgi:6-phosphofructokinase